MSFNGLDSVIKTVSCQDCEERDAPLYQYGLHHRILCASCLSVSIIDRGCCTFCGWADPPEMFKYHTPGDAPVCTACAEKGILMLPESEVNFEQGEGNYQSGVLRLKGSEGQILFPSKTEEGKG